MRQADDLLNTWLPDGSLRSEAVAGTNQSLRVLYRFAGSATLTVVWVTFEIPARGVKRLIAPCSGGWRSGRCGRPSRKTAAIWRAARTRYRARTADAA